MTKDPVDAVSDAYMEAVKKIVDDETLSEAERSNQLEDKKNIFHTFLDEAGIPRPVEKAPHNDQRRKLQKMFDVIRAENIGKMGGRDDGSNPLALSNISDEQLARIMPLAHQYWNAELGLDIGDQLLDFVDSDGSLRGIRLRAFSEESDAIKNDPNLSADAREQKLLEAKRRFMEYVQADNERLESPEHHPKATSVDIAKLALSDPAALDALSDHELEHFRILIKNDVENREEDKQHIEKRVTDLEGKEEDEARLGYLFNLARGPFNKAALREKKKLLEIIELNQKRRRNQGNQGVDLNKKIDEAILARNARKTEMELIGASEDEVRRELNFRNEKIRQLQEQGRKHL